MEQKHSENTKNQTVLYKMSSAGSSDNYVTWSVEEYDTNRQQKAVLVQTNIQQFMHGLIVIKTLLFYLD